MPVISEMVHPRGLDFANQRKVVMLRDEQDMSWDDIASEVTNLAMHFFDRGGCLWKSAEQNLKIIHIQWRHRVAEKHRLLLEPLRLLEKILVRTRAT